MLVEVMVALSVTAISLTGFFGLMRTSIGLNNYTSSNYTATYAAAEGIEVVKNILDQNFYATPQAPLGVHLTLNLCNNYVVQYNTPTISSNSGPFWNKNNICGDFTMPASQADLSNTSGIASTNSTVVWAGPSPQNTFYRVVQVALDSSGDAVRVRSWVFWTIHGQQFHTMLEDYFYYWWKPQTING